MSVASSTSEPQEPAIPASTDPVDDSTDDSHQDRLIADTGGEAESGESAAPQREDAEVDPGDSSTPQAMSDADDLAAAEPPPMVDSDVEQLSVADPGRMFARVGAAIAAGECVVLPTDTVYGIAVDAFNALAVDRLREAKRRGRDKPPPVLIADPDLVKILALDVPDQALKLIDAHWPGPLTLIFQIQPSLRMDLGDSWGTIALRVPNHEVLRQLLRLTGPLAASSANVTGKPPAQSVAEAIHQLHDSIAVYVDAGPLPPDTVASTMIDFTQNDNGVIVRPGGLSVATLRQTVPELVDPIEDESGQAVT